MSGASEQTAEGNPIKGVISSRWIPEKGDAGKIYGSVSFWLTQDFSLGADYRPLADKAGITATWRALSENPDSWKPAIILGTSVDDFRVDDREIQSRAFFGTLSKALPKIDALNLTLSPYAGAAYIDELDELRPVGGLTLRHESFSLMVQYSGTDTHLSLSRKISGNLGASFILWGMEMPGVALRWRF
ncbi:MAG: hypothetical protein GY899_16830 [Verrucomicrobiaceae bacterium]|nr:hypothetical protein [Verrucomicrobiaceae bacterium]